MWSLSVVTWLFSLWSDCHLMCLTTLSCKCRRKENEKKKKKKQKLEKQ
jgi:hypothetical protein